MTKITGMIRVTGITKMTRVTGTIKMTEVTGVTEVTRVTRVNGFTVMAGKVWLAGMTRTSRNTGITRNKIRGLG